MSTLTVGTIQSNTTSPPAVTNSAGTQIGTFCRAWVNFNGTGTVAIRAAFNVSSITDNGVGDYTVNFSTAMVDANYAAQATGGFTSIGGHGACVLAYSTNNVRIYTLGGGAAADLTNINVAIFL